MKDRLIMEFKIDIDKSKISQMTAKGGMVTIIPFTGSVQSKLFSGEILPGGADIQITNAAGNRHMCARYMFKGIDQVGKPCHLFVDNNGWFERSHQSGVFEATPTFLTDSEKLAPYLQMTRFRAEGHPRDGGVTIKIFDIWQQED